MLRPLFLIVLFFSFTACRATLPAPRSVEPVPATPPAETIPAPLPVEPEPAPEPVVQKQLPNIQFTIQVGAFSDTERAARYSRELQSDGLDAYYFIDHDGLSKVRFESFATKTDAFGRASTLQANGMIDDFYIVRPVAADTPKEQPVDLRKNIVQTARRFLGTPYRWGGESARNGFDCSGLTMTVYRLNGLQLPRNSRAQFSAGHSISMSDLQMGDLVFYATGRRGRVSHVGIYTGEGKFIHASDRGKRIRVASIHNSYFKARYMGARRYL